MAVTSSLNSGDLSKVRNVLWDARSKWYDIGVELEFKVGDLDAIKCAHRDDVGQCLTDMIARWLSRNDPKPYWTTLCDALLKPAVGRGDITESIQVLFSSTSQTDAAVIPVPADSNTQKAFSCPCGKCTWNDYLQNQNQCQCYFPHLDVRHLNKNDREMLQHKLYKDVSRIMQLFSDLYLDTIDSFEQRHVDPAKVARAITSIAPSEPRTPELDTIEDKSSIDSVLGPLQHTYVTFFDHSILEYVIDRHGSEEDKKKLGNFLKEFNEYCQRNVFEVPQIIFGQIPCENKKFIIKIDDKHLESAQFRLHDLKIVQRKLADALNINICSLNIRRVDKGCIKVIASCPISIADVALSQLNSNHNNNSLKAQGIHIMPGPPGKPKLSHVSATVISLCWSKPEYCSEDIQRYIVSYKRANDPVIDRWERIETSNNESNFNFEVDQYISDVSFVFKVNAINEYGEGNESCESDAIELPYKLHVPEAVQVGMPRNNNMESNSYPAKNLGLLRELTQPVQCQDLDKRMIQQSYKFKNLIVQQGGQYFLSSREYDDSHPSLDAHSASFVEAECKSFKQVTSGTEVCKVQLKTCEILSRLQVSAGTVDPIIFHNCCAKSAITKVLINGLHQNATHINILGMEFALQLSYGLQQMLTHVKSIKICVQHPTESCAIIDCTWNPLTRELMAVWKDFLSHVKIFYSKSPCIEFCVVLCDENELPSTTCDDPQGQPVFGIRLQQSLNFMTHLKDSDEYLPDVGDAAIRKESLDINSALDDGSTLDETSKVDKSLSIRLDSALLYSIIKEGLVGVPYPEVFKTILKVNDCKFSVLLKVFPFKSRSEHITVWAEITAPCYARGQVTLQVNAFDPRREERLGRTIKCTEKLKYSDSGDHKTAELLFDGVMLHMFAFYKIPDVELRISITVS